MRQYVAWAGADWPAGLRCTHEALTVADGWASACWMRTCACTAPASRNPFLGRRCPGRALARCRGGQADPARRSGGSGNCFTVRAGSHCVAATRPRPEGGEPRYIDAAQAMGSGPACHERWRCAATRCRHLDDAPALRTAQRSWWRWPMPPRTACRAAPASPECACGGRQQRRPRCGCLRQLRQALRVARARALRALIGIEPVPRRRLLNEAIAAGVERDVACRPRVRCASRHRRKPACTGRGRCGAHARRFRDRGRRPCRQCRGQAAEAGCWLAGAGGAGRQRRLRSAGDLAVARGRRRSRARRAGGALRRLRQLLGGPTRCRCAVYRRRWTRIMFWVDVLRARSRRGGRWTPSCPTRRRTGPSPRASVWRGAPLSASLAA